MPRDPSVAGTTEVHDMRTIRPSIARIALIAAIGVFLAACGGSASGPILSTVGNAVDDSGSQSGGTGYFSGQEGRAAPSAGPVPPITDDGVGAAVDDAKIIRTGTISLEVTDVPRALIAARDGIRGLGGYIGASQTENIDDQPYATITYRVPADRWEDALDLLRKLNGLTSKVVTESTEAVEVTGQVIDLEARIRNLRASETALQEIAAGATRISDVLEVQNQLTNVRGQIEQLSAALADLEDRAGFATLTATFGLRVVATELAAEGFDPARVVDEATASLVNILQALTTAGIWFAIVWLPLLLVLGLLVAIGVWIGRRLGLIRRRRGAETPLVG
jgi:Domain of unknown function (DUF4349)